MMNRTPEAPLEGRRARLGGAGATQPFERLDRDHLALLHERAARETRLVLAREPQRLGGPACERGLGPLEQLRLAAGAGSANVRGRPRPLGRCRLGSWHGHIARRLGRWQSGRRRLCHG